MNQITGSILLFTLLGLTVYLMDGWRSFVEYVKQLPMITTGCIGLVLFLATFNYIASSDLRAVQSGEAELWCMMKDGERQIAASNVEGYADGMWLFKNNGWAKNCKVLKL